MGRSIHIAGTLPSKKDLILAMTAEALAADFRHGKKFNECFTPTDTQQEVYDVIENSEVAPNMWLHVMLYGDTGGAKTWTAIGYAIKCMLQGPGCRVLVVRETKGDIMMTTYVEVKEFFERWDIKVIAENKSYGFLQIENGSEIHFRSDRSLAKHDKDKADSLGSSKFSVVIFEECDSISRETYETASGRMRQKIPGIRKVIFAICNPPRKGHWLFKKYNHGERQTPPIHKRRWHVFRMLAKDNKHLSKEYDQAKLEDWADNPALLRRMGHGLIGPETKGIPYFKREFSRSFHVSDKDLRMAADPMYPIWRGWDFGYNSPACVMLQFDPQRGQTRVLYSIVGQEQDTADFIRMVMSHVSLDFAENYNRDIYKFTFKDACDAAGKQVQSSSGMSDIQVLNSMGMYPLYRSGDVGFGLNIISEQLRYTCYQGNPAILIDARCEDLIDSLESGYCVEENPTDGRMKINKDGVYDHIMDAFRYVIQQIRKPGDQYQPWAQQPGASQGWVSLMSKSQAGGVYASPRNATPIGRINSVGLAMPVGQAYYSGGSARRRY